MAGNRKPGTKTSWGWQSPKLNAEQRALVQSLIDAKNDITLDELCQEVQQQARVVVSRSTMGRVVKKLNLTRKKKHSMPLKPKRHGCNRLDVTTGTSSEIFPQKI